MPGPSLIGDYLAALSADLPPRIADELADGLEETYRHHLTEGLAEDAAARAAVAEFGEPQVIVAAFTEASRGRKAARRLLATGPLAGLCWAMALIINRAWTWPAPVIARALPAAALLTVIGLLAVAAFGKNYRSVTRTATAACMGITALDTTLLIAVALVSPSVLWPVIIAATASVTRVAFTARTLCTLLAG
jgi:hypothetical protein